MSYRWIAIVAGAGLLGGAAWYFGRPDTQNTSPVDTASAGMKRELPERQRETETPQILEIVDLASAYDPLREPEPPSGIDPASFIEERRPPARIPYSVDPNREYLDALIQLRETPFGAFFSAAASERIDVQPREVLPIGNLLFVPMNPQISAPMPREVPERMSTNNEAIVPKRIPNAVTPGELVFIPMGVPFPTGLTQPIPPGVVIHNGLINFVPNQPTVVEVIGVMPREVK